MTMMGAFSHDRFPGWYALVTLNLFNPNILIFIGKQTNYQAENTAFTPLLTQHKTGFWKGGKTSSQCVPWRTRWFQFSHVPSGALTQESTFTHWAHAFIVWKGLRKEDQVHRAITAHHGLTQALQFHSEHPIKPGKTSEECLERGAHLQHGINYCSRSFSEWL